MSGGVVVDISHIQGCALFLTTVQQPTAPRGVLAQLVQIENTNMIVPSISRQSLNTFLIKIRLILMFKHMYI